MIENTSYTDEQLKDYESEIRAWDCWADCNAPDDDLQSLAERDAQADYDADNTLALNFPIADPPPLAIGNLVLLNSAYPVIGVILAWETLDNRPAALLQTANDGLCVTYHLDRLIVLAS